ncbi:uncharacterized protein BYT42DRAFT_244737 [Radiomyces spectabilis]|uniref:uncharacterized protein n=1 Tax=Radiomyces spectabilis TaxID=64574 RepID=UPI00221F2DD9|nr:uncharacterized protein BYT42DRAFT_244737 [Radiomyces spectabilis]KAI8388725.1 hypothetical protein BYT42DRAFT_244737 [Radiomyces spectabilis]
MIAEHLPFEVAHCSSWDNEHAPDHLVNSSIDNRTVLHEQTIAEYNDVTGTSASPTMKGWQTPKCPNYPQDLILHLLNGPARINKIHILSHHYKIASKVDVYVGCLKYDDLNSEINSNEDGDDNMLIEFTRLGYVCFDNNVRAKFRARELKSIKVNADGEYIRLVIRSCYRNRLNTYNQVGLLAITVFGQSHQEMIHGTAKDILQNLKYPQHLLDGVSMLSSSTRRTSISSSPSVMLSPAATGIIETELQQWLSALLHAEDKAVEAEAYQEAKVYKYLSEKFGQYISVLKDLEMGKRQAAENKDYDEAEKIKADIEKIKQSAENMLKRSGIRMTSHGDLVASTTPGLYEEQPAEHQTVNDPALPVPFDERQPVYKPSSPHDSFPINHPHPMGDYSYPEATDENFLAADKLDFQVAPGADQLTETKEYPDVSPAVTVSTDLAAMLMPPYLTSYQADIKPVYDDGIALQEDEHSEYISATHQVSNVDALASSENAQLAGLSCPEADNDEPEMILDEEREIYSSSIMVFGENCVACILSVKAKYRERGLDHIENCIQAANHLAMENKMEQIDDIMDRVSNEDITMIDGDSWTSDKSARKCSVFVNGSLLMIQEVIMDSRETIVNMAIAIWRQLNRFCMAASIDVGSIMPMVERAFAGLLKRTTDTNPRIRKAATDLVITLARTYCYPPNSVIPLFIGTPERLIHNHKDAKARIELVEMAISKLGILITNTGTSTVAKVVIPLQLIVDFATAYAAHSHNDVQEGALKMLDNVVQQTGSAEVYQCIDQSARDGLLKLVQPLVDSQEDTFTSLYRCLTLEDESNNTQAQPNAALTMAEIRAIAAKSNVNPNRKATKLSAATAAKKTADSSQKKTKSSDKPARSSKPAASKTSTATGTKRVSENN